MIHDTYHIILGQWFLDGSDSSMIHDTYHIISRVPSGEHVPGNGEAAGETSCCWSSASSKVPMYW